MTILTVFEFIQQRPEVLKLSRKEFKYQYKLAHQRASRATSPYMKAEIRCTKCNELLYNGICKRGYGKEFKKHLNERHSY